MKKIWPVLGLLYVVGFIALLVILGQRNAEVNRWIYQREVARLIMMPEEPYMEMGMPIAIEDIRVRK